MKADDMDPPDAPELELLRALGAHARAQEGEDAVHEALAPIEGEEASMLFDAVLNRTQKPQSSPEVDRLLESPSPAGLTAPTGRRRWLLALAAGFLVAAVGTAVLLRGGPAGLPDYALTSGAGDQTTRADPVAPVVRARYSPGSRLHLVARPATDVAVAVQAAVFVRQNGAVTRLAVPVSVSATGAVRLDVVVGEGVTLPQGEGELVVLVRPVGMDATDEALLDAADPAPARRLVHPYSFSR